MTKRMYIFKEEDFLKDPREMFIQILSVDNATINMGLDIQPIRREHIPSISIVTTNDERSVAVIKYKTSSNGVLFSQEPNTLNVVFPSIYDEPDNTNDYEHIFDIMAPNTDMDYSMVLGCLFISGLVSIKKPVVIVPLLSCDYIEDFYKESLETITLEDIPSSAKVFIEREDSEYQLVTNGQQVNTEGIKNVYVVFEDHESYSPNISITVVDKEGYKSHVSMLDITKAGKQFNEVSVNKYNELLVSNE